MGVRHWSGRKLALVWLAGLAMEGALFGFNLWQHRRIEAEFRARHPWLYEPARPATPAERDTILHQLQEKLGVTLSIEGDTVRSIALTPEAERSFLAFLEGLRPALLIAAVVAAVIYLTIPLALVIVTALWFHGRRQERGSLIANPAG